VSDSAGTTGSTSPKETNDVDDLPVNLVTAETGRPPDPVPIETQQDVAALYLVHRKTMRNVAASVLGNKLDIDDVLSVVAERLFGMRDRGALTQKENWEAYLVIVTRNAAREFLKERRKEIPSSGRPTDDRDDDDGDPRPPERGEAKQNEWDDPFVDGWIERDRRGKLRDAMDQLTEQERDVIMWRYFEDLSFPAIGDRIGLSYRRANQIHDKAVEALREMLGDYDQ
jgi:RNA polymerase sigma factor (sigma-70 family)